MKQKIFYALLGAASLVGTAAGQTTVKGKVIDSDNNSLSNITIRVGTKAVLTNQLGDFEIFVPEKGSFMLEVLSLDHGKKSSYIRPKGPNTSLSPIILTKKEYDLEEVEVFGERNKKPKGLEDITRMPLKPSDQIQTISVISSKVIEAQGALTLTDAVRNVPGVTLFGSYGGVKESMSTRGFRGVPVLKNGVRMESQFQSAGGIVDMQGVESIQMIKGSAAITQGVITDLGNGGGVINVVTKTPNFNNAAQVGLRVGSWGQVRPTFDVETTLDKKENFAFRMNGAYERGDSYRHGVKNNRVFFNPSIAWKASDRTLITLEADYLNSNVTPHSSAVNLNSSQGVNALYLLPYNKLFGLNSDNNNTVNKSITASLTHNLTDHWSLRAVYASNNSVTNTVATTVSLLRQNNLDFDKFTRSMSRSGKTDKNSTVQIDLIGQELYTGSIKHTAQIGVDYRSSDVNTTSYTGKLSAMDDKITLSNTSIIDTINVFGNWSNDLSTVTYLNNGLSQVGKKVSFVAGTPVNAYYNTFGILAQDVIEFNKYLKASLGIRYSEIYNPDYTSNKTERRSAWNPSIGVIVSPFQHVNLFGSYTNSTSLRSAANRLNNGDEIGPSITNQYEAGFKSDLLDNRLRFNFTYFHIYTSNLSNAEYIEGTTESTGYYFKAGDLLRDGIETELNGRILKNLTIMMGYAYLNARYENSPSYVNGSAPMNAPKHTANAWLQYVVDKGALENLSLSAGVYYVGKRPVNEYSNSYDGHSYNAGIEPFDMPAYTTINAQVGYKLRKVEARLYVNNIANEIGLNSYFRGGYINQTDPRNVALSLNYKF